MQWFTNGHVEYTEELKDKVKIILWRYDGMFESI